jgi:hypothetical protein
VICGVGLAVSGERGGGLVPNIHANRVQAAAVLTKSQYMPRLRAFCQKPFAFSKTRPMFLAALEV